MATAATLEPVTAPNALDATTVDAYSTQVPPELRGQGIADRLARRFYDWTLSEGLTIVPSCSYIDVWLRRNAG